MRTAIRLALAVLIAAGCSSTGEPGSEWGPCGDEYAPVRQTIIGPEGGSLFIPDDPAETFDFEGFQLVVPAGAWAECWEVNFATSSFAFDTPAFPEGFLPVPSDPTGSLEIEIYRQTEDGGLVYAPDSMYLELHFPLAGIPGASSGGAYAFAYDAAATDWQVLMAAEPDPDELIVHVSDWRQQWSYGSMDLLGVDAERYLAPSLAAQIGTEGWNKVAAALDSIFERGISEIVELDCEAMNLLESFLQGTRQLGAGALQDLNARVGCGNCDATTTQFWDQFQQYLQDQQLGLMFDILAEVAGDATGNPLAGAALGYVVGQWTQMLIGDYACDYECFSAAVDWEFVLYMALFGGSNVLIEVIDWYRDAYTTCPAPAAAAGLELTGGAVAPPGGGTCRAGPAPP